MIFAFADYSGDAMELRTRESQVETPHGSLWLRTACGSAVDSDKNLPLLLLHGGPGFPSDYLAPIEALADDRVVIFFDQIGAGRSGPATDATAWTVEAYVEHVNLVQQHLGLEQFHVLGHSWGGFLALAYADAYPSKIASLTLSSPLVDVDRWEADARFLISSLPDVHQKAIADGPGSPGYDAAEAEFYRRHFCSTDPWPEPLQRSSNAQDAASYEAMWGPNEFTNTGTLAGASQLDTVRRLEQPILWITGSHDEARPETLIEFASLNAASQLVVLPGTHNVHLEQPQPYLDTLRAFLRRTDRQIPQHIH